jgi:hypothetical protein
MSMFGTILQKLGFGQDEPKADSHQATPAQSKPMEVKASFTSSPKPHDLEGVPKPAPMSEVDVVSKLEGLAASNPQDLDWKVSIVDLLKLLDIDSSYDARKELATELGCPQDKMGDSAQMNTWLHKTVLTKLAENGGNVPKELLD